MEIRFVDWFAGIGGFRLGLEKASTKIKDTEDSTNDEKQCPPSSRYLFHCVGTCEIDQWCRQVYARNFGHEPEWGDSRAVDPAELPDFDLFCAGFPCQSFSIAGQRRGFRDPRGTLFFEILRICEQKRPSFLLLENVRGLLSVDRGFTFETILGTLRDIGYDCQWEVLNSKNFGVPQNRERVFIVGHLRGLPRPQVFPIGEDFETSESSLEQEGWDITNTLRGNATGGYGSDIRQPLVVANALDADGYLRFGARPRNKDGKPQLLPIGYRRLRRLTPLECERLQGFPDGYTEGVSDTQRYKMLGNAVTVNVVEAIGERLLEELARLKGVV